MSRSLDTEEAREVVGGALAAVEEDCSKTWPGCPLARAACACRLRAARAVNALLMHLTVP